MLSFLFLVFQGMGRPLLTAAQGIHMSESAPAAARTTASRQGLILKYF